jgi:DNA-binding response OmpR family regulator
VQILVVEDDPDIRASLEHSLGDAGYLVVTAETGGEALRLAEESPPDLVLLDLMLPDVPGAEVCRILRSNAPTRTVPVIMVTARGGDDDRVYGFEQGADDYVSKPFSMRELLLRIEAVLKRAQRSIELPVDSRRASARERIRVWEGFSANHFERGEWQECKEISRAILRRHGAELNPGEMAMLCDRIRRCEDQLARNPPAPALDAASGSGQRQR